MTMIVRPGGRGAGSHALNHEARVSRRARGRRRAYAALLQRVSFVYTRAWRLGGRIVPAQRYSCMVLDDYSYSAQVEGMGGVLVVLGWGVFGRFRGVTTDSSMGTFGFPVLPL